MGFTQLASQKCIKINKIVSNLLIGKLISHKIITNLIENVYLLT